VQIILPVHGRKLAPAHPLEALWELWEVASSRELFLQARKRIRSSHLSSTKLLAKIKACEKSMKSRIKAMNDSYGREVMTWARAAKTSSLWWAAALSAEFEDVQDLTESGFDDADAAILPAYTKFDANSALDLRMRVRLVAMKLFRQLCIFRGAVEEKDISRLEAARVLTYLESRLDEIDRTIAEHELSREDYTSFVVSFTRAAALRESRAQWMFRCQTVLQTWKIFPSVSNEQLLRFEIRMSAPVPSIPLNGAAPPISLDEAAPSMPLDGASQSISLEYLSPPVSLDGAALSILSAVPPRPSLFTARPRSPFFAALPHSPNAAPSIPFHVAGSPSSSLSSPPTSLLPVPSNKSPSMSTSSDENVHSGWAGLVFRHRGCTVSCPVCSRLVESRSGTHKCGTADDPCGFVHTCQKPCVENLELRAELEFARSRDLNVSIPPPSTFTPNWTRSVTMSWNRKC